MTNLDLYARVEHLLGIKEATSILHDIYDEALESYNIKTMLDIGCGRGDFIRRMTKRGIACKGIDASAVMVDECQRAGLDVGYKHLHEIDEKFDAIVAIFDVLNFLNHNELSIFLSDISKSLNDGGVFLADINTLHGFRDVAVGSVSVDNKDEFLCVDAEFEDDKLYSEFTLFKSDGMGKYIKTQDEIVQYYHKIRFFEKQSSLKLVKKQAVSLYDKNDKNLLIFKS